ncbi:BZIP domain-containing protein [Aphelenchoides besseyi]|nr:BZIP domain-containing protein [Aphelenchoides besseyi]
MEIAAQIFERFLLTESAQFLPLPLLDDAEMNNANHDDFNSSGHQPLPQLTDLGLSPASSQNSITLQQLHNLDTQQNSQQYMEELSTNAQFEDWACEDFNLFDFIGQDEQSQHNANEDLNQAYNSAQKDELQSLQKPDAMYSVMQYNEIAAPEMYNAHRNMNAMMSEDMAGNNFINDERYAPNTSGLLNNAVSKLHLQQQQIQPSTSRLGQQTPQQQSQTFSSAGRMRPQLQANQLQTQVQLNGADLADNVLLPTSSTSPVNNNNSLYMAPIKTEPTGQYDLVGHDEYFDSTSDNESHYSHNGGLLGSAKPRKYRIKPESERANPQYRMKRAKNNDAVRRSREKAKQAQLDKEKRLQFLELEHHEHYKVVNSLQKRINELEKEVARQRQNCSCGSAQQMYRR